MRQDIANAIQRALEKLGSPDVAFVVERPGDASHGDYATNAALVASKPLGKNPRAIAEELRELFGSVPGVEKVVIAGPGFVNFFLSQEALSKEVTKATQDAKPAIASDVSGQRIMVEYTDPNPFKEFHIGHLMSNAIGEAIARTLEAGGATVVRANYQGDVGPHVAKALYILLQKSIEEPAIEDIAAAYVEGAKLYEEDAAKKAEIDALNKAVYEKSDERVNALYAKGKELSLAHFEELYRMLGTAFDRYYFESETSEKGLVLVRAHMGEVFQESDGAVVFRGEKVGLHTRVFINSKGLPTYETKDLGLLKLKSESEALDLSITVTANEQNEYFKVVLAAARELPEIQGIADKTMHVSHGMMRFASGKMSSRRGNVITGESLLSELIEASKKKMDGRQVKDAQTVAEQVAVGAIKYAVLKQGSGKDIIFDPEKSLSLEGDSGPYLQYAHTRALSLLRAAQEAGITGDDAVAPVQSNPARSVLERTLIHFPQALERAVLELEPHHVTTYLTELAGAFNAWYASERVIGGADPAYGVLLAQAFAHTMHRGLQVLGIPVPEEM